ncbi:hypothetical protein [Streptomyces mesophilus]|uniref:hypothetical protein n=1 Tax=Streptomyces mesophilus TaxID=1775132 RepID=UPI00333290AE
MTREELTNLALSALGQGLADERQEAMGTLATLILRGRANAFGMLHAYALIATRSWAQRHGSADRDGLWVFGAVDEEGADVLIDAVEPHQVFAMRFSVACANDDDAMMAALFEAAAGHPDPFYFPQCAIAVYDLALESLRDVAPDAVP